MMQFQFVFSFFLIVVTPGGGFLKLDVNSKLAVEGLVTASGDSGGASGGSVWINTYELQGSGTIKVCGTLSVL